MQAARINEVIECNNEKNRVHPRLKIRFIRVLFFFWNADKTDASSADKRGYRMQ